MRRGSEISLTRNDPTPPTTGSRPRRSRSNGSMGSWPSSWPLSGRRRSRIIPSCPIMTAKGARLLRLGEGNWRLAMPMSPSRRRISMWRWMMKAWETFSEQRDRIVSALTIRRTRYRHAQLQSVGEWDAILQHEIRRLRIDVADLKSDLVFSIRLVLKLLPRPAQLVSP